MNADARAEAEARRYGRTASLLSLGIGMAGVLTYGYFALASHNLSKESYGTIVVLWSAVVVTVSVLYRPVEQLLSRTIAERSERGQRLGGPMRIAAGIQLSIAALCAGVALALRDPIENGLLSGHTSLYWVMLVAIIAYAASFYARGFLAGTRRFGLLAGLLLNESIGRVIFAIAVAVGNASGQTTVAIGIAVAPFLSLVVVPLAFLGRNRAVPATESPGAPSAPADAEFTLARGGSFAGRCC